MEDILKTLYYIHNELEPIKVSGADTVHMSNAFNALENAILKLQNEKKEETDTKKTEE